MKLIKKDFRKETKIKTETLDDLWNLKHIIRESDIVGARTLRTLSTAEKEKKLFFLKIKIEKTEFDEEGQKLKLRGKIIEGPDEIEFGYHTISIEEGTIFSIEKEWKNYEIRRLKESLGCKGLKVLICVCDERNANFALARETGVREKAEIFGEGLGKRAGETKDREFFAEIISVLKENFGKVDRIIIAGPGSTKEKVMEKLEKYPEIKKITSLESSSVTGKTGINEVIKRGGLDRILKESRISKETKLVEKFLEGLGKDYNVSYGIDDVEKAANLGAVEELLVSDKIIREIKVEKIMDIVEKNKGNVHIINSSHEAGEKLFGLGGLGAFLRYKI